MSYNPYTCRLLMRLDWAIWRMRGVRAVWYGGHLCQRYPKGHHGELSSHFPGWMFVAAARIQNRWPRTRWLLSA